MVAIGIDLGTTNSCVAYLTDSGVAEVIPSLEGKRTLPSVVAYTADDNILVGEPARRQAAINPGGTIQSVKRLMGRRPEEVGYWHGPALKTPRGKVKISVPGEKALVTPQEVSARILLQLKNQAEQTLQLEVSDVVITVPAYFNDAQRQATKEAGKIAGLNVLRIINEPTAAALAYGLGRPDLSGHRVLVFDLGGGTFDVSVLEINDGVFEVLATDGDNGLGGDDWDLALADWIRSRLAEDYNGFDPMQDPSQWQRVMEACEGAKRDLSALPSARIDIPYLGQNEDGPIHVSYPISRQEWEALTSPLFQKLLAPLETVMREAGLRPSDLDEVLLVGGMTRVPMIATLIEGALGKKPSRAVNPDEAVAMGAAIQANVLATGNRDILLLDVTPLSLGIETRGGIFTPLISRNTTIPTRIDEIFTTADDNQSNVEIHVLQGERTMAEHNRTLARLYLQDIPPAKRGVPQIAVTFALDADGILQVSARDLGTGHSKDLVVETGSELSPDEMQALVREAESQSQQDRQARDQAEINNRMESLAYSAERALGQWGDMLASSDKDRLADAVYLMRRALAEGASADQLASLQVELEEAIRAIGAIYGEETLTTEPVTELEAPNLDDVVVDAQIVENDAETNDQTDSE